jgi:hypothetical protein
VVAGRPATLATGAGAQLCPSTPPTKTQPTVITHPNYLLVIIIISTERKRKTGIIINYYYIITSSYYY